MINERSLNSHDIEEIIELIEGDIIEISESKEVNAIVNAAKPTLMGGSGVDGAIHNKMNQILEEEEHPEEERPLTFKEYIKRQVDGESLKPDQEIRCKAGEVKTVKLNFLYCKVKYIINAVGPEYDKGIECIHTLERCYKNIINEIFKWTEIEKVAIPIISSGNYGFPMDLAFRIALTTIANDLIERKHKDYNKFKRIKKIYLVIYSERSREYLKVKDIYKEYEPLLIKEKRMIYDKWKQLAYMYEIWRYDAERRNYFTITMFVRWILIGCRFLFFPSLIVRHMSGKRGWRFQKEVIEIETIIKMLIPIICIALVQVIDQRWMEENRWLLMVASGIIVYIMTDTITYLLLLIFLADIQGPSTNQLRTLILLVFNYLEMIAGIAFLYYMALWKRITFWEALDYSILGREPLNIEKYTGTLRMIEYSRTAIEFLFMVLSFAFFISHLKQRKFMGRDE